MAVFRIEKTRDYTVMSNYHLQDIGFYYFAVAKPVKDHLQGRGRYHCRQL